MIRNVLKNDYKQITDIYNYYILNTTVTFEEDKITEAIMGKRINEITKNYPFIVYVLDDQILGYAYLSYFNTRSAYRFSADLSIYVKKGYEYKHIGTDLYENIEKIAKDLGFKKIISCITEENKTSISFHKRMGFMECGLIKNVGIKFNKSLAIIWMDKDI